MKFFSTLLKITRPQIKMNIEKQKLERVNSRLNSTLPNNIYLKFSIIELIGLIE